jgi:hypothetical protein
MTESAALTKRALVRPLVVLGIATAVAGAGTFGWAAVEPPAPSSAGAQGIPASPVPTVAPDVDETTPAAATAIPPAATPHIPATRTSTAVVVPAAETAAALPVPTVQAPSPTIEVPTAPLPTPEPTTPPDSVETPEPAAERRSAVVATGVLNLRAEPGLGGEIVATLSAGDWVAVLAGPTTVDGLAWYRIDTAGVVGWSAADYLRLDEPRLDLAAPAAPLIRNLPGSPAPAVDGQGRFATVLDDAVPVSGVVHASI